MNEKKVGDGNVYLISGGGKIFTDIAARFVRSDRTVEEILSSPYDKNIVNNILDAGHKAATEFDYFIFGIEGYSRVTEIQLVRKRLASYIINSGRIEKKGKRQFNVVLPEAIKKNEICVDGITYTYDKLLNLLELWYNNGVELNIPEEELRYLKPMATEFKAIVGMNAHALYDWFQIRCCMNAQTEIRDLANKMLSLCKTVAFDIFKHAGPSCKVLGYCPEGKYQHVRCKNIIPTKEEALSLIKQYYKG